MVAAAIRKAEEIGVLETVCIVDEGGYPLALERMDGARITGPQIAWNKAFTAAGHKRSTHLFNQPPNGPALPGNEAFGIQWSFEGRFAVFVGGFPIVVDDEVVGGVGLSGGNGEQDTACGIAALEALQELLDRSIAFWSRPTSRCDVGHAVTADFDGLSEHAIYLCGSPAMISSAKQDFISRSASMEHICTEGFTLQCARPAPA